MEAFTMPIGTATDDLVAELYTIDGKAEIVDGRIVRMSPTGWRPGRASVRIFSSLANIEKLINGYASPDNVGFVVNLPNRKSFSPDAAFKLGPPPKQDDLSFVDGAPDFAVEVRSESDYGRSVEDALAEKRADYFAAGTKVVWDVDLLGDDVVRVYRADKPTEPTIYKRGESAEAEPAVSGWKMPVDELFE
jgi:Uma2 family endonuclease